jgi:hypothetical protein
MPIGLKVNECNSDMKQRVEQVFYISNFHFLIREPERQKLYGRMVANISRI